MDVVVLEAMFYQKIIAMISVKEIIVPHRKYLSKSKNYTFDVNDYTTLLDASSSEFLNNLKSLEVNCQKIL